MALNNLLILSYDGTPFYGWQKQPNLPTIQGELEKILSKIFDTEIKITGAGRTDKGVHALRQVANFFSPTDFDPLILRKALNSLLPEEIRVIKIIKGISPNFDARKSAMWREYKYFIYRGGIMLPFLNRYCYHLKKSLNLPLIKELSSLFVGTHDFSAFCDDEEENKSKIRTIYSFNLKEKGNFLIFTIRADSFLRHMVRIMLSTLIDIALGKKEEKTLERALSSGERKLTSAALPPQGLWLWKVGFKQEDIKK